MHSPREGIVQNGSGSPGSPAEGSQDPFDITTAKFKVNQVKRQDTQKKAFTRWVNSKIQTGDKPFVNDLFVDLRDGNNLLTLLETLTGRKTTRVRGALRLHKLNNINVALDLLKEYKIKLVNIGNTDIVDGVPVPTLGLIWSVIYRFQIQGALSDILQNGNVPSSPMDEKDAEKAILQWCANAVEGYEGVDVKNFSTSWKDGLAFNALIHRYKPNLFIYKSMLSKSPIDSLEHAFTLAEKSFGVHRLLEPSDFQREMIDSRLVVMYVSTLYEKLKELDPKPDETVTLEEIEELKTYIKTELEFLEKSGEFFEHASDLSEQGSKEDSVNQYEKLIAFIDDLQPHQVRVGELVVQIESLIAGNLIAEEEIEPLSSDLDALKKLWQTIFDQTSERQEKLREMLLDTIETPMNEAFEELQRCKEKLQDFSDDADRLTPAWNQYSKFQDYVNELRQLESKIETIRTGDEIGDALAVLSDEDAEVVSTNIQGMIEGFISLGQDVADAKDRITENLYQLLNGQMKDLENTLQTAEKVTTNDLNNNTESLNLHERQAAYKGLLEKLYEIKPNIDSVSSVCRKLDENFDIEGIEVNQLKQKAVNLEEGCEEQIENLQKLCVQVEHQLENKGKFDHWKSELDASMVWIKEKSNELDSIDDLESSLIVLEDAATKMESLYMEINNYQDKIDSVVKAGSKIIKDEDVESEAVPSIKSDIRSLESTWELLREKCTAVQSSIQEKVAIRQMQEKEHMAEWKETHTKIDDWLTNAEDEANLFDKADENIVGVEDQVTEHEELVFRLATEEKTINDLLEVGENLAGEKLRMNDNKLQVKNDLKLLKKRKTKLNARLIGQQESLTSFLDHLAKIESEAFEIWLNHCKTVQEEILSLGNSNGEESVDTVDGAKHFISAETALLTDIEALQTAVDDVVGEARALVAADQLGKLKRQGVKTASKSLHELYEKKKLDATLKLEQVQEELQNMQQQQAEQVSKWINKCETLDMWIDSETKELETLLTFPEEEATLDKVIDEEQAIKEIKSNVDSRTSILEALTEEGGILKENSNIEIDHPEEYLHIIELMVGSQYKWEVLNKNIDEKISRVINILSQMQGQLLSACKTQIEDLENAVDGLGPIPDGYDTLAKDAEVLSEIFMMIGQTRANVERFNKYANEIQSSEELPNAEKFEIRDANETLHNRMLALSTSADERQNLLHEKIIDVLTESLVALNDTVASLEEKCDEILVPDNLETVDLVERYSTLEDLLNRLIACDMSLKDIKGLGKAADNFMILESGEPDDIMREIEKRNVFINHVQQMAREKRSRIYGLMVYTFKRRIEELDNLLSSIEEGLKEETESSQDIQSVLGKIKNNESSLQELDDIQKNGEEVTLQVNEIIESNVISEQDKVELQEKNSAFVDHLSEVFTALKMQHNNLNQSFSSVAKDKLAELREWLNLMDKRREGDDQIGPDSMTIKKQITEMNVVESQLKEKRLTPYIHHDDEIATQCLDPETLQELKEADHDWNHLAEWIAHRTKVLHATQDTWENFRQVEVDLLDYLRDKERQIKNWEPINLEDEEAVAERLILLKAMLSGMEDHKDDVSNMHKAADEVIDLIGNETPMANNIKSQVADIHDCWNSTVRQVIEAISKLNFAKEKLLSMEEGMNEIRSWLDDAKSILKFYTDDVTEDTMEDLKPSLEEKRSQEESKRRTLRKVNSLSQELLDDIDGPSHDVIRADVTNLNKDWNEVTTDLDKKREIKKKSCCSWCYRRWFLKYGYYN